MKTTLLIALLALASVSLSAQAENLYATASIGQSHYNVDDSGLTATARSEKPTAYKIDGGYKYSSNIAFEIGYADLGQANNTYDFGGGPIYLGAKTKALYAAVKGEYPVTAKAAVFGKIGVSENKTSVTGFDPASGIAVGDSVRKTGVLLGVGASYQVTNDIAAVVQYEDFGKASDGKDRVALLSGGVRFNF